MAEYAGPRQLRRLLDAVMSLGSDLELAVVLQRIVEAGRELVGARYAALGVLDPTRTYLSEFITAGMDDEVATSIGELPKGHGILGLLITSPRPLRLPDLGEHTESFGFPPHHPRMGSFLGVPLYVHGEAFGNLYFTEKLGDGAFSDIDEELAVALAASAAVSIENVRLHERTQKLSLLADRERLGRDLHDTVIQQIFGTGLAMHATAGLSHEPEIQARIVEHIDQLDEVVRQLRMAIFELDIHRPANAGVRQEILAVVAQASRSLGFNPVLHLQGPIDTVTTRETALHLIAVLREALSNVAHHAHATAVDIAVEADSGLLTLDITDNGIGLPGTLTRGDGLDSMHQRAELLGGSALVSPLAGGGTAVRWSVPLGTV